LPFNENDSAGGKFASGAPTQMQSAGYVKGQAMSEGGFEGAWFDNHAEEAANSTSLNTG
jgi:hypothetical protein